MLACGRSDGWTEQGDGQMTPHAAGKVHVLHEWNVCEATECLESSPAHKNGLITKERAEAATTKSFPRFEPTQARMTLVELASERAAAQ